MDIFDRSWCNLYVWTPAHGAGVYHIRRDRAYWAAAFDVLAEFWWSHVVPGRQCYERGALGEVERYRCGPGAARRLRCPLRCGVEARLRVPSGCAA